MVTISTDDHTRFRSFEPRLAPSGPFSLIPNGRSRKTSTSRSTRTPSTMMIPHTLVLKPGRVIHSIYNGYWYWGRPSIYDLWQDLRAATREIRPDWDLSKPGLREEWDRRDFSHFHGWDKAGR